MQRVLAMCTFLALPCAGVAVADMQPEVCGNRAVEKLSAAPNKKDVEAATKEVFDRYHETVRGLIGLLRSAGGVPQRKEAACYLLGLYRAENGVDVLIEHIDLLETDIPGELSKIPIWDFYPCEEALSRIGASALAPLEQFVTTKASGNAMVRAVETLTRIEGRDAAKARMLRRKTTAVGSDLTRIEQALALLTSAEFPLNLPKRQ